MHHIRRILGAAAFFAMAVLWSNLWGQLRDSLSLGWFDDRSLRAYGLALKVPFEVPQLISTALAAAMVPVLVELARSGKVREARRVAAGVTLAAAMVFSLVAAAGALMAGPVLQLYYWNDADPATLDRATSLSRLLFPYLAISGTAGALAATLQAFEWFFPLTVGQLIPNVVIVGTIFLFHDRLGIASQAYGVVLGGAAYLLLVMAWFISLQRFRTVDAGTVNETGTVSEKRDGELSWWRHPAAGMIVRAMFPLLLIGLADWGTSQLTIIRALSWVARKDDPAFKEFMSAYRILQIPQTIFVSALSMVLLPLLSRYTGDGDKERLASMVRRGIRLVLYTVTPTVILIGCLALPVLNVLYRHGRFSEGSAVHSAALAGAMAPYVVFSSTAEVLILCLYALKKVWTLLAVQAISLAAAVALSAPLAVYSGKPGIAAAVSLVALVNLAILLRAVEGCVPLRLWQDMPRFAWKLSAACTGLLVWVLAIKYYYEGTAGAPGMARNILELLVAVPVSAVIYAGLSQWLDIPEWQLLRGRAGRLLPGERRTDSTDETGDGSSDNHRDDLINEEEDG